MEKYIEFISRFPLQEKSVVAEGYEFHHIVPKSEQIEKDERGVLLLPSQHLWAHILYDRENKTNTSSYLLSRCGLNIEDIKSYEDCTVCDKIIDALREQQRNWGNTHKGKMKTSKEVVIQMYDSGVSTAIIAKSLKISKARIYQILDLKKRKGLDNSSQEEKVRLKEENIKLKEEIEFLKGLLKKLSVS